MIFEGSFDGNEENSPYGYGGGRAFLGEEAPRTKVGELPRIAKWMVWLVWREQVGNKGRRC